VGLVLGAVIILLVLGGLAFAIHASDAMLKDPNTSGGYNSNLSSK
jgi:hypothetical protein